MKIPDILIDPTKDYYKIMGVSKNANYDQIKKAKKRLLTKYHPDRESGDEEKYKEVNEAYDIIGNKENRKYYNLIRKEYNTRDTYNYKEQKKKNKPDKKKEHPLSNFLFNSFLFFQKNFHIKISDDIQDNFKEGVQFAMDTWRRLKKENKLTYRFGKHIMDTEEFNKRKNFRRR